MFDANLRLLPNGFGFVAYVENLSNKSPLFAAGLRRKKLFIGRKPLHQPNPEQAADEDIGIEVFVDGRWLTTHNGVDILDEWLVYENSMGPQQGIE